MLNNKKTWDRGKKRLTEKEKQAALEKQKTRVRIANLVARNKELDRSCCVCGKPGIIMHNTEDPYYISFICKECSKSASNKTIAIESRRDIRKELKQKNKATKYFTDEQVKRLMISYMNDFISIGEFCKRNNITRYQFNRIVERYSKLYTKQPIKELVAGHSNAVQSNKISVILDRKHILDE